MENWSDEAIVFLHEIETGKRQMRKRGGGTRTERISRKLKKEIGENRSSSAINSQLTRMRKYPEKFQEILERYYSRKKIEPDKKIESHLIDSCSICEQLGRYDVQNIYPLIRDRQDLVYKLMEKQAGIIKAYDLFTKYSTMPFTEALKKFSTEEIEKIKSFMPKDTEKAPKIKTIEIIALPGSGAARTELGIILPVYFTESAVSEDTFASYLNDRSLQIIKEDFGFKPGSVFQIRFKDLVRYNFKGQRIFNPKEFGNRLEAYLKKDYASASVKKISVLEDNPIFYEPLDQD